LCAVDVDVGADDGEEEYEPIEVGDGDEQGEEVREGDAEGDVDDLDELEATEAGFAAEGGGDDVTEDSPKKGWLW